MDKWYMQQLHNLGCYAPYVGRTLPVGHRSYMGPITLADDINPILFTARGVLSSSATWPREGGTYEIVTRSCRGI